MVRRLIRIGLWTLVGLVGLVVVAAIVVYITSERMLATTVAVPAPVAPVAVMENDPATIARGQYLVDNLLVCKVCHADDFGGRAEIDDAMIGRLWGPNLTAGRGSGVAGFTAEDWSRSVRHGVAKDGRRLILMPSEDYYGFSDEDIGAVVAYIKSRPAVDRDDQGITLGPLGRALLVTGQVTFAFDDIEHTSPRIAATPGPTREWGSVLIGACIGCHGPGLSGGVIPGGAPEWPAARNLTPHETGLKGWTFEQFTQAVQQGVRPDGSRLRPPMPYQAYAGMTEPDLRALWLLVQSVPARSSGGR